MDKSNEKLTSVERKKKVSTTSSTAFGARPPTTDATKSKPSRPQLKPISTPVNAGSNVRSLIASSGASTSSRKCRPLVESHRQAMRVERDILGLPIVKKDTKQDAETPLNSARSSGSTRPKGYQGQIFGTRGEKISLFEALELADSIENQENSFHTPLIVEKNEKFEKSEFSDITTESIDFESSDFSRRNVSSSSVVNSAGNTKNFKTIGDDLPDSKSSESNLCQKRLDIQSLLKDNAEATATYNRYLRSIFLAKKLEHSHSRRKISAFCQLTALAEENNRLEDQICQLKIHSDRQAYNQIIWDLISVQSEQTAKLVKKLRDFLPLFTKLALLVDSTRHRFFFENIDVPSCQNDPEGSLQFCVKMTELLEIQKKVLESILNSNSEKKYSEVELGSLVKLGGMFLESSKLVEKDITICEERCHQLFLLVDRKDSSDLPSILNSVSCVDNCNLDFFKF